MARPPKVEIAPGKCVTLRITVVLRSCAAACALCLTLLVFALGGWHWLCSVGVGLAAFLIAFGFLCFYGISRLEKTVLLIHCLVDAMCVPFSGIFAVVIGITLPSTLQALTTLDTSTLAVISGILEAVAWLFAAIAVLMLLEAPVAFLVREEVPPPQESAEMAVFK